MAFEPTTGTSGGGRMPRPVQAVALGVALLAGSLLAAAPATVGVVPVLAQDGATPVAPAAAVSTAVVGGAGADLCPDALYGPDSEPWVRSELYFGTTRADGTAYTEDEFLAFLDAEITPRFPAGLTLLTGIGQWQDEEGILQERSQLLIILYPYDGAAESSRLLEEIRDEYEQQFQQQSVLRADSYPVCTSF